MPTGVACVFIILDPVEKYFRVAKNEILFLFLGITSFIQIDFGLLTIDFVTIIP